MQRNDQQIGWLQGWLSLRWIVGTSFLMMLLAGVVLSSMHYYATMSNHANELRLFQSNAMTLDERLTMSARLAAVSGDPYWEERYRQTEVELEAMLQGISLLLNRLLGNHIATVQRGVTEIGCYNEALVALENQSFERLRTGDSKGAAAAVMSPEYDHLKKMYANAVARFDAESEQLISDEIANTQRWAVAASTLTVLFVSVVIGWIILAVQARHKAALAERTAAAEQALADLSAFKAALDQHNLVSVTDLDGSITEVNEALCRVSQYTREELVGANHRLLNSGTHPKAFWKKMWRTVAGGGVWGAEVCDRAKDGSLFWVDTTIAPIRRGSDTITGYVSARVDITERKRSEKELLSAARTDKLTGLANRALLYERLQQAVLRARRNQEYRFAVLFLDFDRFKLINDSLGHMVGDLLIKEIAARLRMTVRSGDSLSRHARGHTAARFGGDEFVVLLDGIERPDDATLVADRLLEALAQPYHLGEHEVFSTASIGIATSDMPAVDAEEIMRNADTAMYEAKLAGKGRYVEFNESMHNRVENRLSLENDLRKALDAGQIFLMYQPIVSLESREFESVEALVRWNHPERGLITPGEFIPMAEDMGLIIPIGEWVLRESCRQFAQWRQRMGKAAPRSISVNLSRNQLAMEDLAETIRRILEETGVPPSCLHLELTEGTVMRNVESATRMLHAIKETGVKLCLDDFGTGYSSLSCLHLFPIDILKIDRSFVANIDRGRDFIALVHATVQLAHNLGIRVVAEGIETADQIAILQSIDCEFGQGFLFSRPMMPEQVEVFKVQSGPFPGKLAFEPNKERSGVEKPLEQVDCPFGT